MRLFVAAELSAPVRRSVAGCAQRVRERLAGSGISAGLRWIPPDNLHLTIWFLGELSEARANAVLEALAPPLPMPAFDVALEGFGAFPPAGGPRVVWMGVSRGRDDLARAHELVGARLVPWGFPPEGRAYSAHLTIARVKDAHGRARAAIRQAVAHEACAAGTCTVGELVVFRSRTESAGAVYEPLLRVPLT
jgi:2'-5' RNA ligase